MKDNFYKNIADKNEIERENLRHENIVWSISENYNLSPRFDIVKETKIEELDFYRAIILGALHREKFADEWIGYFLKKISSTKKAPIIYELIMLTLEEFFAKKLLKNYAGIKSIQNSVFEKVRIFYEKMSKRRDVFHEVRYAHYTLKSDKIPKTNNRTVKLVEDIFKFSDVLPEEFIQKFETLVKFHFHFEEIEDFSGEEKFFEKHKNESKKQKSVSILLSKDLSDEMQVMSAEFNQTDIGKDEDVLQKDNAENVKDTAEKSDDYTYKKIVENYGLPSISSQKLRELERELSVGVHKGEKLHITDRFMEIIGYKKQALEDQRNENIEHFEYGRHIFRRNIIRLKNELIKSITEDMDYSRNKLDNGMLMSNIAWRKRILGENKIFYKNIRDTRGELAVDILLDSSGSQIERQSMVATQGFIIAEALLEAGISCRVSGFNNLFDYTVIKIYREYSDPKSKNAQIFSYQAQGSNRDGMAIATIGRLMQNHDAQHKVLIVLSDGKPNDERVTGAFNLVNGKTKAYTGELAISDTAHQVRLIRNKGISVLGIFTGVQEDIKAQQKIFGTDFAYIKNVNRFADVVAKFLKIQIKSALEI